MADDIVITEFGADLSKFNTEVDKAAKSIDNLDGEMKDASKAGKDLSGNMGDAGKKVAALGVESKKTAKDVSTIGASAGGAAGFFSGLFNKAKSAFGDISQSAGKLGDSIKGSFNSALSSASGSLGSFGSSALAALGPIGIAIAGIGGLLVKVFANTDAGATYFDGLKRAGGIAFDKITGAVTGFFSALTDGQTTIGKVFGFLGDAIDTVTTPLQFLVSTIGNLTGITQFFKDANKEGQELANAYDKIDEAQRGNIVRNAELEKQVSSLNIKLRDRTKTDEERLKIADELTAKEKERANNELDILKKTTAAAKLKLDGEKKNNEVSDDTDRAYQDALAAEIKAEQASAEIQERAGVRRNLILQESENKATSIKAKADADRAKQTAEANARAEKAAADAAKRAQELAAATAKATEIAFAQSEEARRSLLTPDEIKVDDISLRYQKEQDAAAQAFNALKALQKNNATAIAQIDKDAADTQVLIEANKQKALADLRIKGAEEASKTRADQLDAIYKATQDEADIQRDAINNQFNELETATEMLYADGEEKTKILLDLETARFEALKQVKDANQLQDEADLKASQDRQVAIIQGASTQLNALLEGLASGQIQTAKQASDAIIGITLDTVGAVVQAEIVELIARSTAFGAKAGPVGAALGLAGGTALGAILKGLLNALKGQLVGNFQGDPYVTGTPMWSGRDGHLRRLDEGERVVTRKDNEQHWEMLEAMRTGKLDQWKRDNLSPLMLNFERLAKIPDTSSVSTYDYAGIVNRYVEAKPERVTLTMPKGYDRGMIKASRESTKEQRRTNDLLEYLTKSRRSPSPSKRTW
jgi:chemotaxis protein histidine kinase CheA